MASYALKVNNLCKKYSDFQLCNISFSVPSGSIVGFIGENGAGKSTTIKSILNLIHYDNGSITFFGGSSLLKNPEIKDDIGVVFDEIGYYETLTPLKIEKICSSAYSRWDKQKFFKCLSNFNLSEKKEIKEFSKGMKMKLSLAVALSHNPKLLILDEPTSGLDPIARDELLDIFLDFIQDENHSVFMSSHIISDLEKAADYIVFIHKGKVIFSKSKDELINNYGVLHCGRDSINSLPHENIAAVRKQDYEYQVLVKNRCKLKQTNPNLLIERASLEDIMLLTIKGE